MNNSRAQFVEVVQNWKTVQLAAEPRSGHLGEMGKSEMRKDGLVHAMSCHSIEQFHTSMTCSTHCKARLCCAACHMWRATDNGLPHFLPPSGY